MWIVRFVEVKEDDPLLRQFRVRAQESKEFSMWFQNSDIPPAGEAIAVLTDKACCPMQCKSGIAKKLETSMFSECYNLTLQELVLTKYVRIYAPLL